MNKMITIIFLLITSMLAINSSANAQQKSSEHYYSVVSMQIHNLEKFNEYRQKTKSVFESVGGKILRDFDVEGKPKGSIPYGEVNRVTLVEFNSETGFKQLSTNPDYKKYRPLLKNATSNLKVLSGSTHKPYSAMSGELFILKISNYKQPDGQAQKLAYEIGQKLQKKYDFYNDVSFKIKKVKGLSRADDVGLFLYKKASDRKRLFSNKESVKSIGLFNKTHLDSFVYLTLRPVK